MVNLPKAKGICDWGCLTTTVVAGQSWGSGEVIGYSLAARFDSAGHIFNFFCIVVLFHVQCGL